MPLGSVTPKKMYAALRRIGFDSVMDTNFTADLTIMEEGTECVTKLKAGEKRPLITSCSPGWIKFMETYYPDLADCVSTAKSPMSMFGVLAKTITLKKIILILQDCFCCNNALPLLKNLKHVVLNSRFRLSDTDYVLTTRSLFV
jgi:NADH-quinone oxidoreductase subunit G